MLEDHTPSGLETRCFFAKSVSGKMGAVEKTKPLRRKKWLT